MLARLTACLALALACALPASAQEKKKAPEKKPPSQLLPVDEAARDLSWVSFRNRLLDALRDRDRKFVLSIVARNVRNSLDAPRGLETFRRHWDLDSDEGALWRVLPAALHLGSAWIRTRDGRELCAPYVAAKWPEEVDPFEYGAITSKDALVKAAPSSSSETLGTLSYDLVRVTDWEVADAAGELKQKWVKIRFGEREGFVFEEQIRSPLEHRACFMKTEAGWRLTSFVVGLEK